MSPRDRPGWAQPSTDPSGRIVSCPNCGRVMTWAEYLAHGRDCPESETED